eukprot:CAMPEP_0194217140 /NCGR_PEP_ID=MMETSP0156-20130528/20430_1 /TAXON_ID=33649 /ORGANISM="Thalassionema nitzschioides, Strain L26-B" /LENGTH=298 /DNA_ID=CAMNT_0038946097 /DNA_START=167 /DNA_END=1063 /DNA_ORIENTATION=+
MSSMSRKIGFVGLGNMGLPMCMNLIQKNQEVMVHDLNKSAVQTVEMAGADPASALETLAKECSIIITMLPGCQAVNSVMDKLIYSLGDPAVLIDCSTVSPATSRRWDQEATKHGHSLIDAPVSGGVKGAEAGTLTFMVGCENDSETFGVAEPVLKMMGKRVIPCGGPGTGAATKLCNNLALSAQMVGICEAMNLGEALGVDPQTLADVMNESTAKCWSCEVNNPHPEVGDGTPATNNYEGGFATNLMLKDLGLAVAAGNDVGVSLPVGVQTKEMYRLASLRGLGDKDFGVILQFLRGK